MSEIPKFEFIEKNIDCASNSREISVFTLSVRNKLLALIGSLSILGMTLAYNYYKDERSMKNTQNNESFKAEDLESIDTLNKTLNKNRMEYSCNDWAYDSLASLRYYCREKINETEWITPEIAKELAIGFMKIAKLAGISSSDMAKIIELSQNPNKVEFEHYNLEDSYKCSPGVVYYNEDENKIILQSSKRLAILGHEWLHLLLKFNSKEKFQTSWMEEGTTQILARYFSADCETYNPHTLLAASLGKDFYLMRIRDPEKFKHISDINNDNEYSDPVLVNLVNNFAGNWGITDEKDIEKIHRIFRNPKFIPLIEGGYTYGSNDERVAYLRGILEQNNINWHNFLQKIEPEESYLIDGWKKLK